MTNYEKYKDNLLKELMVNHHTCTTKKEILKVDCPNTNCDFCKAYMKEWLEAEYVEPEIDWSKVPMGTPVRVWDDDSDHKYEKTFVIYNEKCVDKFITVDTKYKTIANWRYAELIEV